MKKIVIDARESGTGTGRYVDKLIEYLHMLNPALEIVLLAKPHRVTFLHEIAPRFEVVETTYKEFGFGEQLGFWRQIARLHADLVHFPMVQQPILYRGKTVTTIQDLTTIRFHNPTKNWLVFTLKREIYKFVNWYAAHKSDALIAPSEFVKRDAAAYTHVPLDKFAVTYESSDPIPDTPTALPYLTKKQFIMYVGRPLPHKNLWRLVEAFQILQRSHPALYLVLVGKKDTLHDVIERRIQKEGIEHVILTGRVSEGTLRWLYEHTAAYTFPSLSEGFGLPALEALRHGAPLVSSNATCSPEIYGNAAHYFDPLNVQDMATKIGEVLDNEQLRQTLIAKGKTQANKYSWQRMAEQTLAVYTQVLNKK